MKFVLLALLAAASCLAEDACPFLNAATAGGFLGGSVRVSVTATNKKNDDALCEFTRESADYILRIEVKTMSNWRAEFPPFLAQCPKGDTLRGIGNEAIACGGTSGGGKLFDQVLSRVRERSLFVRVTTSDKHAAAAMLREQSSKAADEVSGNLF